MSAAAARRRKQLLARQQQENEGGDAVSSRLKELLEDPNLQDEATAYEALQLAQSQVRKKVHAADYTGAADLAYTAALAMLKCGRVSVASQLLQVLVEVLRETHTQVTDEWIDRIVELHQAQTVALEADVALAASEKNRLARLERDFLHRAVAWSADLGTIRYGNLRLQELLAQQCWMLSQLKDEDYDSEEEDPIMSLQCDAIIHMALAEKPHQILEWLKSLPPPTPEELKMGHACPPACRDALLTRSILLFCAVENLRDANTLLRGYIDSVEERDITELTASYMNKEDGKAPSHAVFGSMLLRVCEKDKKTGPLYSWMLRSFKRELEGLYKPQSIQGYTTKIGKVYFDIQPPPSMMSMMENMMGMMGGGGMNPAALQAMMGGQM